MSNAFFGAPIPANEPVKSYAPGTHERREIKDAIRHLRSFEMDIPMYIGGKELRGEKRTRIAPPHDHAQTLGYYHPGTRDHVKLAIESAIAAKSDWANLSWEHRASIFLKAAELIAGPYRAKINA